MALHFSNTLSYDMSGRKRKKRAPKGEVYGKYRPEWKPMEATGGPVRRDEGKVYKSASMDSAAPVAARNEPQRYTGTLVKGIATMHKSNAVPIINQDQAKDISQMRRS